MLLIFDDSYIENNISSIKSVNVTFQMKFKLMDYESTYDSIGMLMMMILLSAYSLKYLLL